MSIGFDMSMACDMSMPEGMSIRQITKGDWAKPSGLGIQPIGSNARSIMAASANCTAARRKVRTIGEYAPTAATARQAAAPPQQICVFVKEDETLCRRGA